MSYLNEFLVRTSRISWDDPNKHHIRFSFKLTLLRWRLFIIQKVILKLKIAIQATLISNTKNQRVLHKSMVKGLKSMPTVLIIGWQEFWANISFFSGFAVEWYDWFETPFLISCFIILSDINNRIKRTFSKFNQIDFESKSQLRLNYSKS